MSIGSPCGIALLTTTGFFGDGPDGGLGRITPALAAAGAADVRLRHGINDCNGEMGYDIYIKRAAPDTQRTTDTQPLLGSKPL